MAFAANSYSNYFRAIQSPVCAVFGPTGASGAGYTGPTGPTGPAGSNGISTGLTYYFHAEGVSGQMPAGYTGFTMNKFIHAGPVGGNPVYPQYDGYFSDTRPTAGTTGPVVLGKYQTSGGDPGVPLIPSGTWNFIMNIYSGIDNTVLGVTGLTGTTGSYINVYAEIWKTTQNVSSLIGTNKSRPIAVKSAISDELYTMGVNIDSPGQTLFIPGSDSMFVIFYAVPFTSTFVANQRIEFWTDGDSVSQVITTLPSSNGNTGSTGAVGPTGAMGLPGTPGANGSQGIQGPTGPGIPFVGDLVPQSVSQRYGPLFYDRTQLNQLTAGPYYWSYVVNQYSQAINCRIDPNGMPNGMIVINWSLYNPDPANYPSGQLPSAMVAPQYSPIPGDVYATPWTYEPPHLSMLAAYNPTGGIYSQFSPRITGVYMISISINSDQNGIAQGGTLAFIDSDVSRNLSNMISPRPWQNTTTFIATMFYGKNYCLCGGGHGALNVDVTVFAGTQIQFYLLSPL